MNAWLRRLTLSLAAVMVLTVAVPFGQATPAASSKFPLAGLWELLTTRPAWALGEPVTPRQQRGGPVEGAHAVPVEATRANGGLGRAPGSVPGALAEYKVPGRADLPQQVSGRATVGFQADTSRRVHDKASANEDVFANADGSMTRKVYASPVNYRGTDGAWHPIDSRLRRDAQGRLATTAGEVKTVFASTASELVSLTLPSGERVAYGLAGAADVQPSVTESTAVYQDVLPHTDVELTALGIGVKETLVLKSAAAVTQWVFPLTLKGLTPRQEVDGSIVFRDNAGAVRWVIPVGSMTDSRMDAAGEGAFSNAVTYELVTVPGGGWALRVSADAAWVRDPARVFPIRADPTFQPVGNATTFVQSPFTNNNSGAVELKTGYHSSGPYKARAFIKFDDFSTTYRGFMASAAKLWVNVAWSGSCPSTRTSTLRAHDVGAWTASGVTNWSNQPQLWGEVGSVTQAPNGTVCANHDPVDVNTGQYWGIPFNGDGLTTINRWTSGGVNNGLAIVADLTNNDTWKKISSIYTYRPPYLEVTYEPTGRPQMEAMYPPHGYASPTLTPELVVSAKDPDNAPSPISYVFRVFEASGTTVVADSGQSAISSRTWMVPAGKLEWGKTYVWAAAAFDGASWSLPFPAQAFTTQVPQPLITSSLSQNASMHGFDPRIGNYTTQVTDANVATIGPALALQRTYNSRDPRTGSAFGAGWSSLLDASLIAPTALQPGSGGSTIEVTLPSGQEVVFARNANGTYAPPPGGLASSLVRASGGGLYPGFVLTDKEGTKYAFTLRVGISIDPIQKWALSSITDSLGRTLELRYVTERVSQLVSAASGRSLHVRWAGDRVDQVSTDPVVAGDPGSAQVWRYYYAGGRLDRACAPEPVDGSACTRYAYGANTLYPTVVLDAAPHTYLRLSEAGSSPSAASSAVDSIDTAVGTYVDVTSAAGGLPGSDATAAAFNGTSSRVELGKGLPVATSYQSVALWFKTTGSGVLYSYQSAALTDANAVNWNPALYVDTNGKLRGQFWTTAGMAVMSSANAVNDGRWHHAVITGESNSQSLYLDGAEVATLAGQITPNGVEHAYVGAGKWHLWPDTTGVVSYFPGQIRDFAFYTKPLAASQVRSMHWAAQTASAPLERITRPSGGVQAEIAYDRVSGMVRQVTDSNGGRWQISDQVRANPGPVYRSAVLSRAPRDYFRFADGGPATATNEVNGGVAQYNEVTLGVDGGPFGDDLDAAGFNGTSSYVRLPAEDAPGTGPASVSMWFQVPAGSTTGGVLYSHQSMAIGDPGNPGQYVPALFVGTDGKLHAYLWTGGGQDMTSPGVVNDGKWHHVALAGSSNSQSLYVDGVRVAGPVAGALQSTQGGYSYVGAGKWVGWPSASANPVGFFTGQIAEFAFFRGELNAEHVAAQYRARSEKASSVPAKLVDVVDPGGKKIQNVYDLSAGGRQVEIADARGKRTLFGYDVGGFPRTVTDPNGNMTISEHDSRGNVVSQTSCQDMSENRCSTTYYTYYLNANDPNDLRNDKVIETRDARSSSPTDNRYLTTYAYDATGNLLEVTDPLGRKKKHEFTDGKGAIADFGGLAASGRFVRVSGTARATEFGYSLWEVEVFGGTCVNLALGRPAVASSLEGSQYTADNATDGSQATRWSSAFADPQWIYVDLGSVMSFDRVRLNWESAYGKDYQIQVSNDATNWSTIKTVTGQAGTAVPAGLASAVKSAGGAYQQIAYAASGDIVRVVDPAGLPTCFKRDGLGRIVKQTVSSVTFPLLVTSVGYDRLDRVVSLTEPETTNRVTGARHTRVTTVGYDVDGQIRSTTLSDPTGGDAPRSVNAEYNAFSQKTSQSDAKGAKTFFGYDAFGRTVRQTTPDGVVTEMGYDEVGNRITVKVNGQLMESSAYDPGGRKATVTDAMGWQSVYTYTDNNLLATSTRRDPSSGKTFVVESNVYDAAGNALSQTTNNGVTTAVSSIDQAGRIASQTVDATGVNRSISYAYGADDTVLSVTRSGPSGSQTQDALYDPAGRLIWQGVRMPLGTGGPSGWWQLNETSGTTAADSTAGARNATASGAVTWSNGGAEFAGAGSLGTSGPVLDSRGSYTVSAWAKLTSTGSLAAVASQDGNRVSAFVLEYHRGANLWNFWMPDADADNISYRSVLSTTAPTLNAWTHLAGVYDAASGVMKLYVNGVLQGTQTAPPPIASTGPMRISGGRYNATNGGFFNGGLDNVAVYQRALTDAQIGSAFNSGRAGAAVSNSSINTSWTRDQAGNALSQTDANGNVWRFEYDESNRLVRTQTPTVVVEENGVATSAPIVNTIGYDTFGGEVERRDGRGLVSRVERDANGRAVKSISPAYTAPGTSTPMNSVTQTAYDTMGRVDLAIDPLNQRTYFTYDPFGRVKTVKTPDEGVTSYTYHPDGQPASVTDPTGARSEATHDFLGRPVTRTQLVRRSGLPAEVLTTTHAYHAQSGWLEKVLSPDPARGQAKFEYNNVGEITKVTDAAGNVGLTEYDFAGREAGSTLPDGSKRRTTFDVAGRPVSRQELSSASVVLRTTSATYDGVGNVLTAKDARGTVSTFAYSAIGTLTQATQPISATDSVVTSFGYDANGQATRHTDGRGGVFRTTFNTWNLPESQIDADGSTFTTTYDVAARVDRSLYPGGVAATHTYDVMNRVTRVTGTGAEAATQDREFGYDATGRITSLSGSGGSNTLSYDDRGLLTSITGPSGDSSFSWTADGLMASRMDAAGTTSYTYDVAGRLKTAANDTAGLNLTYAYNNLSQINQITYGTNQNRRVLTYDGLHRLSTDELKTAAGTAIGTIAYGWDLNDNETSKTTTGFAEARSNMYTYDLLNRLKTWNNGGTTINYAYDKSGNRTQAGGTTFTYNAANRLQSSSDGTTYEYTPRGTLRRTTVGTVALDTLNDAFGQTVKQYSTASEFSEYAYDGLGRMIQPGFAYTGTDNDLAKDPTAAYVRDPGGGLLGSKAGASGTFAWTDLHADVVAQFTASGTALVGSTAYEPFGKVISSTSMQGSLGYQSEWTDTKTKRVNMHARWYNPDTGQFDSRDTVNVPNRFNYVDNNPLVGTDPSGHMREMDEGNDARAMWLVREDVRQAKWHRIRTEAEAKRLRDLRSKLPGCMKPEKKVRGRPSDEAGAGCVGGLKRCAKPSGSRFARYEDQNLKTLKNCTTVQRNSDSSCEINDFTFERDDPRCHDPYLVATYVDNYAGRMGGYQPDGTPGDRRHLTALMINEATVGAAMQRINEEAAACQASDVCRNATNIGLAVSIFVGTLVFAGCTAASLGIGAVGCMAVGAAIGEFAGSIVTGKLQGKAWDDPTLYQEAAFSAATAGTAALVLGPIFGAAGFVFGRMAAPVLSRAMPAFSGIGARVSQTGLGRLFGQATATPGRRCAAAVGGEIGFELGLGLALGTAAAHSFDPSTRVLKADGETVDIKEVKVGDEVTASNPDTGESSAQEVTAIHTNVDRDLVDVTVGEGEGDRSTRGPTATLHTTEHHPFWDATTGKWVDAGDLRPGESTLIRPDGKVSRVVAVQKVHGFKQMRDLTVANVHTYYVVAGNTPVLVHNCGTGKVPTPSAADGPHVAMGLTSIRNAELQVPNHLADFAADRGAITWQDRQFADIFSRPAATNEPDFINRIVESGGRISFSMRGIQNVEGMVAGRMNRYRTGAELHFICGNAIARAATTFFHGPAPC